ncbi:MAG TPA: hypothetical protein VIR00_15660, partial [Micromonosporaceae bacterium]
MTDTDSRAVRAAHRREGEFPPAPEPLAVAVMDSHTHLDIVGGDAASRGASFGWSATVATTDEWSAASAALHRDDGTSQPTWTMRVTPTA